MFPFYRQSKILQEQRWETVFASLWNFIISFSTICPFINVVIFQVPTEQQHFILWALNGLLDESIQYFHNSSCKPQRQAHLHMLSFPCCHCLFWFVFWCYDGTFCGKATRGGNGLFSAHALKSQFIIGRNQGKDSSRDKRQKLCRQSAYRNLLSLLSYCFPGPTVYE